MGQYPITAGVFGKALAIPGTGNGGTITTPSAWLFENQSGTLGTNYNSSQVYVGVTGDVVAILSDTVGVQDAVTSLNLQPIFSGANPSYAGFAAGSGYFTASNVGTTVVSLVHKSPANQPANLTVNITVPLPVLALTTAGSGYTAGNAFTTTVAPENLSTYYGEINDIAEEFVEDSDYIKFRQMSLGYSLPGKALEKIFLNNVRISLIASNLFYLKRSIDKKSDKANV